MLQLEVVQPDFHVLEDIMMKEHRMREAWTIGTEAN